MKKNLILGAGAALLLAISPAYAQSNGDAARGERLYESRCGGCHSLDANRVGPKHRGVFGRRAGAVAGFPYSKAVKTAGIVWDEKSLDSWLTNPQRFIPGQRMNFRVRKAQDRTDIIAFLRCSSRKPARDAAATGCAKNRLSAKPPAQDLAAAIADGRTP